MQAYQVLFRLEDPEEYGEFTMFFKNVRARFLQECFNKAEDYILRNGIKGEVVEVTRLLWDTDRLLPGNKLFILRDMNNPLSYLDDEPAMFVGFENGYLRVVTGKDEILVSDEQVTWIL